MEPWLPRRAISRRPVDSTDLWLRGDSLRRRRATRADINVGSRPGLFGWRRSARCRRTYHDRPRRHNWRLDALYQFRNPCHRWNRADAPRLRPHPGNDIRQQLLKSILQIGRFMWPNAIGPRAHRKANRSAARSIVKCKGSEATLERINWKRPGYLVIAQHLGARGPKYVRATRYCLLGLVVRKDQQTAAISRERLAARGHILWGNQRKDLMTKFIVLIAALVAASPMPSFAQTAEPPRHETGIVDTLLEHADAARCAVARDDIPDEVLSSCNPTRKPRRYRRSVKERR